MDFTFSNMTLEQIGKLSTQMLAATEVTLQIFVVTSLLAIPLGVLVALGRMSKIKLISAPVRFYQFIMRGTPLILQLIFIYFGPKYIAMDFGITLTYDRLTAGMVAFVVNYAAYYGEIFRGGIESISASQYEAGKVLGYNKFETFRYIVLPQVIKRILPSMGNESMVLIKDTALVSVIAVTELYSIATKMASTYVSVAPFMMAGIFYLVMNMVVENIFNRAEKRLDYYK